MDSGAAQVIYFYTRHPISSAIILSKLRAARGHLDGVTPYELFPHDQDHYGALAANDVLAHEVLQIPLRGEQDHGAFPAIRGHDALAAWRRYCTHRRHIPDPSSRRRRIARPRPDTVGTLVVCHQPVHR